MKKIPEHLRISASLIIIVIRDGFAFSLFLSSYSFLFRFIILIASPKQFSMKSATDWACSA